MIADRGLDAKSIDKFVPMRSKPSPMNIDRTPTTTRGPADTRPTTPTATRPDPVTRRLRAVLSPVLLTRIVGPIWRSASSRLTGGVSRRLFPQTPHCLVSSREILPHELHFFNWSDLTADLTAILFSLARGSYS